MANIAQISAASNPYHSYILWEMEELGHGLVFPKPLIL